MLESFNSGKFEYKRLTEAEQQSRGILGRLKGIIADTKNSTRNGRKYSSELWENVFNNDVMKEKIANRCVFGELGHPTDREETDMEKIAICLAEQPKMGDDGKIYGVFDILSTPNGKILKALCDYGCNIGVSSRGTGDLYTDDDGNEAVDPETYNCECWDAVLVPAVKEARMQYVSESLEKKRYNKTLRQALNESIEKASDDDRVIMNEALDNLGIKLEEDSLDDVGVSKAKAKLISQKRANDTFKCAGHDILGKDLLDYFEPDEELTISHDNVIVNRKNEALDNLCIELEEEIEYDDKIANQFKDEFDIASKEECEDIFNEANDRYAEFDPEDAELHRNTDWKARNYEDLPVPEDSFEDDVVMYRHNAEPEHKNVKFIKRLRSNPIFPPYYAPEEEPFENSVGGMYNGRRHGNYDIHDRYEDQETYDRMFESREQCRERLISKLRDSQEAEEPAEEISDIKDESLNINEALIHPELYNQDMTFIVNNAISREIDRLFGEKVKDRAVIEKNKIQYTIPYDSDLEQLARRNKYIAKQLYEDINESAEEVVNDKSSELVAELQEALLKVKELEDDNLSLQERLSVCNAKENQLQEQLDKYKKATVTLSESAKQVKSLNEDKAKLEENLNKNAKSASTNKARIDSLIETKKNLTSQLTEANAQIEKLNEQIKVINENLENNSKQLEKSNTLLTKYRKNYADLKEDFIEVKAANYGLTKTEVKNKLNESFSLSELNSVCEELHNEKSKLSKLPFVINEKTNISFKKSDNEYIINESLNNSSDDFISDSLLHLANLK